MEETLRTFLIDLAVAFERETDISRAMVGKRALNDNTFYDRIEKGAGFNIKTFDRVVAWLSDNWPEGVAWPDGIERPHKPREVA